MITEQDRKTLVNFIAMQDAQYLEKLLDQKAKLLVELQQLEREIKRKTNDLVNITKGY